MSAGQHLAVRRGDKFTIELESNPSTGYEWRAIFDAGVLRLASSDVEPLTAGLAGSPRTARFTFEALKEGNTSIRMIYKRAWEERQVDSKEFLVSITAQIMKK